MELVFVALPVALLVGGAALAAFIWAARDDQFEDLDTPAQRAIFDEVEIGTAGLREGRRGDEPAEGAGQPLDSR
jgi:cbb3-type cytochrome oxidase maturation protein